MLRRAICTTGYCLESTARGIHWGGLRLYGCVPSHTRIQGASTALDAHVCPRQLEVSNCCSNLRIHTTVHNGTRRSLRDSSRLCGCSAREVLLARLATQHMDHCHAGYGWHDPRSERAVHANTRPNGARYAVVRTQTCDLCFTAVIQTTEPQFEKHKLMSCQDHAIRRHSRRARLGIHHH